MTTAGDDGTRGRDYRKSICPHLNGSRGRGGGRVSVPLDAGLISSLATLWHGASAPFPLSVSSVSISI